MNKIKLLIVLCAPLAIACGPGDDAGRDEADRIDVTLPLPNESDVQGNRLQRKMRVSEDGFRAQYGWHDPQFDEYCTGEYAGDTAYFREGSRCERVSIPSDVFLYTVNPDGMTGWAKVTNVIED